MKRVVLGVVWLGVLSSCRPVMETIRVVLQNRQQFQQQDIKSKYAEQIFKEAPQGRTKEKAIMSGQLWLKREFPFDDEVVDEELSQKGYILNQEWLYFTELENVDYRSIEGGVSLLQVPTASDSVSTGECCHRIHVIQHLAIGESFKGYCFKISLISQEFLLCQHDYRSLDQLRVGLTQQTIRSFSLKWFGYTPSFVTSFHRGCTDPLWNWTKQSQDEIWQCDCQQGIHQSPLAIDPSLAQLASLSSLFLRTQDVSCIQYAPRNKQPEFKGEFGTWRILEQENDKDKMTEYQIEKIVIKTGRGSHSIKPLVPADYLLEIEMHSFLRDGTADRPAILSILMRESDKDSPFIDSLNTDSWHFSSKGQIEESAEWVQLNAKGTLNLKQLLPQRILDGGYYFYQGSLDHPPCTENVLRVVMAQNGYLSKEQYYRVLVNGIKKIDQGEQNVREQQRSHDRLIQFSPPCLPPKTAPHLPPAQGYKFIKATQQYQLYASTYDLPTIKTVNKVFKQNQNEKGQIKVGESTMLSKVDQPESLPVGILQELLHKYTDKYHIVSPPLVS